ncbi:MAG: hypothetical protein E6G02_13475 [Actinobacteria bacterium]|nr:MAG: hypothetical protein E6G02_13475 [Actinomycetota bacterium]
MGAPYDALELQVLDQKGYEYIRARDAVSIDEELVHFLRRTHAYELGWVKVEGDKYIRYDRIASVSIKRGLSEESGPAAPASDESPATAR